MLYFLVTTSLFNNCEIRKSQYQEAITTLRGMIESLGIAPCRIILIENNGRRPTFLDTLGCEVFYTMNNFLPMPNNGYKELQDILDCIAHYNIQDSDFIVKMTGRYILEDNSEFMQAVKMHLSSFSEGGEASSDCECIIRFGSFNRPVDYQVEDCITGLIGMCCRFIKHIEKPGLRDCVEWKWGKATYAMDRSKIHKVGRLGIRICPGSNTYFSV